MEKLDFYLKHQKIPNLLFHGPPGSGKKTLLRKFIYDIYKDKSVIDQQVMYVNCAYGKGIKFIREDVKYFSKINTHSIFKSVVLLNAEKLTPDAQFALRRCIEQFSYNTRFFIVTSDKYKLIRPILSRFSELYISSPINYHSTKIESSFSFKEYETDHVIGFKTIMSKLTETNINEIVQELYENAYSVLDLENYVENEPESIEKYQWLVYASKIKSECRLEELLMLILLTFYLNRKETILFFM